MAVMFTNSIRLVLVFGVIYAIHLQPFLCQFLVGNCPCLDVTITEWSNNLITITCREPNVFFDENNSIRSCIDIDSSTIQQKGCNRVVQDVIIATQFHHTFIGDVQAVLQKDTKRVALFGESSSTPFDICYGRDVNVILRDDATIGPWNEAVCDNIDGYGVGGTRRPIDALSSFDGLDASGRWILYIHDHNWQSAGRFGTWSLTLTLSPSKCPTPAPTTDPTLQTMNPTLSPTTDPTSAPTSDPTMEPTMDPTSDPTGDPTSDPTLDPTMEPTTDPTSDPTTDPTLEPTKEPTMNPITDESDDNDDNDDIYSDEDDKDDAIIASLDESDESDESDAFAVNVNWEQRLENEFVDENGVDDFGLIASLSQETLIILLVIFAICMMSTLALLCCCKRGFDKKVTFRELDELSDL